MKYSVVMTNNLTNETRTIALPDSYEWEDYHCFWMWSEGNWGCDCNRRIVWDGEYDHDKDYPCTDTIFSISGFILEDGTEIEFDGEDY